MVVIDGMSYRWGFGLWLFLYLITRAYEWRLKNNTILKSAVSRMNEVTLMGEGGLEPALRYINVLLCYVCLYMMRSIGGR